MPLHSRRARRLALAVLVLLVGAGVAIPPLADRAERSEGRAQQPRQAPAPPAPTAPVGAVDHLHALQRIADRNGGNRAAGTRGDRASVRYVEARLRAAGFRVRRQAVRFPFFEEREPPRVLLAGRAVTGIATLAYSPGGAARGPLRVVDPGRDAGDDGCRAADFARVRRGDVVLVERGACRLRSKVDSAARAGASAAVIFNDGRPGRRGTIPGSLVGPGARIPAVSASFATGRRLARAEGRRVAVRVRAVSERRTTHNVIADAGGAEGGDVIMAGAHLDSVPEGPGINDNASGVAALLDSAESLARAGGERRLRIAFWGAEEAGLLGSRHYVRGLPAAERRRIRAYLNLDMVGSPNAGRFIYSSDDGSALEDVARRALARQGVEADERGLGGGSDHASFDRAGIPIMGLFSGASAPKSQAQQRRWGGRAGAAFDRCYHRRCDRIAGIDRRSLDELGGAATDTLRELLR